MGAKVAVVRGRRAAWKCIQRGWWLGVALWCSACAAPQRPPEMARVAEVRGSPAAVEAEKWAPQAHAHALELEERAERALKDGDDAGAALLAEQAIAAHEHAFVLARLARAERRRLDAQRELAERRQAFDELRAQHQRLEAEAAGLELQAQAARAALPLPAHELGSAERQESRRRAAGALATQARLLCVGARLLGETQAVAAPLARLDELDQKLGSGAGPKEIETATELRTECSRVISNVRQKNVAPAARGSAAPPAPGASAPLAADVLLDELSDAGVAPSRDDRGVAVSLRDVFAGDGALTPAAREALERLGRVAGAHPDFPVLLVGHSGVPRAPELDTRLALVRSELARSGASKIDVLAVGDRIPLLPPGSPSARERNQRVELVFVAPGF